MQSAEFLAVSERHFPSALCTLHSAFDGAPGQICTDTERGLSPSPLLWATGAEQKWEVELLEWWIYSIIPSLHHSLTPSTHSANGAGGEIRTEPGVQL